MICVSFLRERALLTRHKIAKAYSGHCNETEIKSIEKVPIVLPQHKHTGAAGKI